MALLAEGFGVDPGFIIWVVIVAFFAIINLFKKVTGKDKPERPPRPATPLESRPTGRPAGRTRPSMEEQVREAFRELTGAKEVEEYEPPTPPPLPTADPRIRFQAADAAPLIHLTAPPTEFELDELNVYADYKDISDIMTAEESMEHHTGGGHNIVGTRSMLVDLHDLSMPMFRIPVISMNTVDNPSSKPNIRKRKILRNAVLGRILLEPPKALQPSPSEDADEI